MKKTCFIFGVGYSAQMLAKKLLAEGWHVAGTCRSKEKAEQLAAQNIQPFIWMGGEAFSAEMQQVMQGADYILHSIPPHDGTDDVYKAWQRAGFDWNGTWFGYLCTTGVYGDAQGEWVDEDSPLLANSPRQNWRVDAEKAWLSTSLPVHSFRLAGIYGPERNSLRQLIAGTAHRIVKEGQFFSRIHVEDIVNVLYASMHHPDAGRIYNVCDDEPAPSHEVMEYAAGLMGVEPPPAQHYDTAELSPMARSFYSANRRVKNDRIKQELGVELSYPNYRLGLQQCHAKLKLS